MPETDSVYEYPFGAATFLFGEHGGPTVIQFRLPALSMVLMERQDALKDERWTRPGVYFLLGPGSELGSMRVYVGKSTNVARRISEHVRTKDWWDRALVVVADWTEGFTTSEVEWLEAHFIQSLRSNIGGQLTNSPTPKADSLPAHIRRELFAVAQPLEAILRLLGVISYTQEPEVEQEEADSSPEDYSPGSNKEMTWLEAALQVLPDDGTPLHSKEITERVINAGLRDVSNAATPHLTLGRDLRVNASSSDPQIEQTAPATFRKKQIT